MTSMTKTDSIDAIREELQVRLEDVGLTKLVLVDISGGSNNTISLDRICSMNKGKKNADNALSILLAIADECERDVELIPRALSDETKTDQLERWYARHHFARIDSGKAMRRCLRKHQSCADQEPSKVVTGIR